MTCGDRSIEVRRSGGDTAATRSKPLGHVLQRLARQLRRTHVHVTVDVADAEAHQAFGAASFELPGQEVPCLPQQRDDAGPGKASLFAKPGLVFVADRKPQRIGRRRSLSGLAATGPAQAATARGFRSAGSSASADRTVDHGVSGTARSHARRYCATCASLTSADQDIPPRKIVEEPARIGAVVPDHHRAVSLAGQYDPEFGDQFAIGIRHRWLLCWSNDRRGSPGNNAEQSPPPIGGITRDSRAEAAFLHIIDTSRLLTVLKADKKAIFTAASKAQQAANYLTSLAGERP